MFLFFTIVFITYYLYSMVETSPVITITSNLTNAYKKLLDKELPYKQREEYKYQVGLGLIKFLLLILFMYVSEFIYLIVAIKHDALKIPTLLMLAYFIYSTIFNSKSSNKKYNFKSAEDLAELDKIIDETKSKKWKIKIINLLNLIYFSYIFYLIVLA